MHHFSKSPYSSQMLFFTHLFLFSLTFCFLLLHATASSSACTPEKLTCGHITMDIKLPFFINNTANRCSGALHAMSCIDLSPAVKFKGVDYFYPVKDISYSDHTMIIYDLKLSSYFRGSDCNFFYNFSNPLPDFNFTYLSMYLTSGESFYNCKANYNFSHDIFLTDYNLSLCQNYSLYYTHQWVEIHKSLPSSCTSFNDLWFHWKLSFGEAKNSEGISLLGAGFSPPWNDTDCFSCRFDRSNCSRGAGVATCSCSSNCQAKKKSSKGIIIGTSVGASIGVFLLGSVLCFIHLRRHRRRHHSHPKPQHSASSTLLCYQSSNISPPFSQKDSYPACYPYQTHIFSYEELYEATNSFDRAMEIGDGGFGTVYKGKLCDGRAVAVKCLYESNIKRVEQFANEIVILSRLRHQNLVSLYGCTSPRSRELILVYEFVANGTVADHLHGVRASEGRLNWPLRLSIAIETATALTYLHAIKPPIIHRDVKTVNILLDTEFHVKVADFGLSRLFPPDGTTHISTAPQGTPGYLDPEYHQSYQLTDRSDVYSFGVVLAELISSKPAVDLGRDRLEVNLSTMAVNMIQKGNLDDLMDRGLGFDTDLEIRRMMRLVAELAFRCLQTDRELRPPIKEVLEVLKGIRYGVSEGYSVEQVIGDEGKAKEMRPFSPDSVTEKWGSRSSTPACSH